MSIGKVIRQKRREKDISQKRLAEIMGVSKISICQWERGHSTPSGENVIKLMTVLEFTEKEVVCSSSN